MQDQELKDELIDDENIDDEFEAVEDESTEQDGEAEASNENAPKQTQQDFKDIVIKTVTEIIEDYKELMRTSGDDTFMCGLEDSSKNINECINYVMNNLTKQRIFGGRDSLMYPFIHDYYVDEINKMDLEDHWSSHIRGGGSSYTPKEYTDEEIAAKYDALSNEKKNEIYMKQLEKAEKEAERKAQEKIKEREAKKKEQEKAKKEAEKLAKEKEKEEALKNGASEQLSLFGDF